MQPGKSGADSALAPEMANPATPPDAAEPRERQGARALQPFSPPPSLSQREASGPSAHGWRVSHNPQSIRARLTNPQWT